MKFQQVQGNVLFRCVLYGFYMDFVWMLWDMGFDEIEIWMDLIKTSSRDVE